MPTFADKAIEFFLNLNVPENLPDGISVLNPYKKDAVQDTVLRFYKKYFNDNRRRIFLWGINPGRFGGGLTGIAFTDPVALNEFCGIDNNFSTQRELSSKFIYEMILAYGGVEKFFSDCFLTALYPLALIKEDKNCNYYDETFIYEAVRNEIISSITAQVNFGADKRLAVCLGKKNYKYLSEINNELNFFDRIEILEHPRYIMQYKSKLKHEYIKKYVEILKDK